MVGNFRAETKTHNLVKHLIAHFLESKGKKAELEVSFGDYIADVFDYTTGIAYEVQSKKQPKLEKEKLEKALLHAEIEDVIFIYLIGTNYTGFLGILRTKVYTGLKYKILGE